MALRVYTGKGCDKYIDEHSVVSSNYTPVIFGELGLKTRPVSVSIRDGSVLVLDHKHYVQGKNNAEFDRTIPVYVPTEHMIEYLYTHRKERFMAFLDRNPEIFDEWGVYKNEKYRRRGSKNQRWQENRSDLDYNPQNVTAWTKKLRIGRKASKLLPDV